MGSEDNGGQVYDLRRIEDVFACLEIISIARGALFAVDPGLARRMEKVSDALGAFSQLVMEGGLEDMAEQRPVEDEADQGPAAEMADSVMSDLTMGVKTTPAPAAAEPADSRRKKEDAGDEESGIVDILTGERIR